MAIQGTVQKAAPQLRGFDIDSAVTPELAQQFVQAGYHYCIRYVPLDKLLDPDLTTAEAEGILGAGLSLMVVQHVLNEGWLPTAALGAQFGQRAVQYLQEIGFPGGVNVWCDLECVGNTAVSNAIEYCANWHAAVAAGGYVPGLYVGYGPGIPDEQLYDLPFQHYWASYNTNSQVPTRGYQLVQSPQTTHVAGLSYDDDMTYADSLGGSPLWLSPG